MYTTTHFHSTTHEVLCVFRGRARLIFGGEINPARLEKEVKAGDAIVIPAGVGHRLLEDLDGGFQMIGSYPEGCNWDMCYGEGKENEKDMVEAVKRVPWLRTDPLYGDEGPVTWDPDVLEKMTAKRVAAQEGKPPRNADG